MKSKTKPRKPIRVGMLRWSWELIREIETEPYERRIAIVRCRCGTEREFDFHSFKRGAIRYSCGCTKNPNARYHRGHHGRKKPYSIKVRRTWFTMLKRCENPKDPNYRHYGARGISVCDRWKNFDNFFADMGEPPELTRRWSIDRIDNDGNYEPGNVQWATPAIQNDNKQQSIHITIDGVTRTPRGWIEAGVATVSLPAITTRIRHGMDPVEAVKTPALTGLGSAHHHSKLTTRKVVQLRELFRQGASKGALARKFGICRKTVRQIVAREIWKQAA